MNDPEFKDGAGKIYTINQLKQIKPYSKLSNTKMLEIAVRNDYNLTQEQYNAIYRNVVDKEKIEVKDIFVLATGIVTNYFSKNSYLGIIGTLLTVYEAGEILRKLVSGYGSEKRTAFKIAYSLEIVKTIAATKINEIEVELVKNLASNGGSKDFVSYIAIYPGNYKLPKTEEEAIKKGLLNYNKIKGRKALTYSEVLEILQRDYYYRKYKGDSRIYIDNKGRAIEFNSSQRGNEHVR